VVVVIVVAAAIVVVVVVVVVIVVIVVVVCHHNCKHNSNKRGNVRVTPLRRIRATIVAVYKQVLHILHVCVFVALRTQHAKRGRLICGPSGCTVLFVII